MFLMFTLHPRLCHRLPHFQILSLGAGFDSLYFRLHADGALQRAVVFEVDFPDVSRRKAALICANVALRGALDSRFPPVAGLAFCAHAANVCPLSC